MWPAFNQRYYSFLARNSSQRSRRLWVAILYSSLVIFSILGVAGSALEGASTINLWLWLPPFIALGALVIFAHLTVHSLASYILSGDYLEDDPLDPDERQREVKQRARAGAYWIVLWALFVGYGYWLLAFEWKIPMLSATPSYAIDNIDTLLLLFVVLYLPYSVIAWTEPDPIPEIEEGELTDL